MVCVYPFHALKIAVKVAVKVGVKSARRAQSEAVGFGGSRPEVLVASLFSRSEALCRM